MMERDTAYRTIAKHLFRAHRKYEGGRTLIILADNLEEATEKAVEVGGYTVSVALESGDKVTRAEPFSSQWLAGNVDVKVAEWNDDYFRQLENFPIGKLKDMVDASANAYLELEVEKPEFSFSFG